GVEQMDQPGQPFGDLGDPALQQGQDGFVALAGGGKDGAAAVQGGVGPDGPAHQGGGGSVPLPAARRAAGAGDAVQRVGPHMAQLAAQAPGAFQQAAAGQHAAAQPGADGHPQHVGAAP